VVNSAVDWRMTARTRANLDGIAAAGIGLALDDFGTGQSSLSHLCRLRLDAIKLDRRFVATAPAPVVDAIVTAVGSIGRAAGVMVLAEGIETAADHERMRRLGCQFGQGWHFGRPMPADALAARLRAQAPDSSINPSAVARATASSRELAPSLR
jgi:EAL domain-containing protein (putative c-di-GMP-specific phosphodiesterase class I)